MDNPSNLACFWCANASSGTPPALGEGRVTDDGMREVAQLLGITTAEVRAVATFYTMLHTERTGRHVVCVCTNLSCALRGANDLLAAVAAAQIARARAGA